MATKTDTTYRINLGTHGTQNEPVIRAGDLASDFVTYRFFFGFSHFRNSERFNLWDLFEKEILPFCVNTGANNPLDCCKRLRTKQQTLGAAVDLVGRIPMTATVSRSPSLPLFCRNRG